MSRPPSWTRGHPDHGLIASGAAGTGIMIAVVVVVALGVWALAPASWQSLVADEQRTDATALTVISIWANNLLICCLPVLAGIFGHRLVGSGRRGWARVVMAVAALGVARSLLVIGLVGGLDLRWLVNAAAWWVIEVMALGACCAAAWHAFRSADSAAASRRLGYALTFACPALSLAAVVEVALT